MQTSPVNETPLRNEVESSHHTIAMQIIDGIKQRKPLNTSGKLNSKESKASLLRTTTSAISQLP
jgi:hypothetical protein